MKPLSLIAFLVLFSNSVRAHPSPTHSLNELERHLAEDPNDAEILIQKAKLFLNHSEREQARLVIEKLRTLAPEHAQVLLLEARFHLLTGKTATALLQSRQLTKTHPDFADGWQLLAQLEKQVGDLDAAIVAQLRFLKRASAPSPDAVLEGADWLRERDQGIDRELAIRVLDQRIEQVGLLKGLQLAAMKLELSLGRTQAALRRLDQLAARFSPSLELCDYRYQILHQSQRTEEALQTCDNALALVASIPPGRITPSVAQQVREKWLNRKRVSATAPPPEDTETK